MNIQSESSLSQALQLFENCQIAEAFDRINTALVSDLDDRRLIYAVRCCKFWMEPFASIDALSPFEQGEVLLNQWKQFGFILSKAEEDCEKITYSVKKGVFSRALQAYSRANDEKDSKFRAEILRKTGLCYKKLGSYEIALQYLTEANQCQGGQAEVLAEMADCYALCGETKNAKMLYREAFYINPSRIDLAFLDSPIIKVVIEKTMEPGYTGVLLQEWIPVYGVIYGIFNVKRQLRSQEALRLKQEIYSKENEVKDPSNNRDLIKPRLLNLYLWLIDYYVLTKESVSKINEVLLKMKLLDSEIHDLYVK